MGELVKTLFQAKDTVYIYNDGYGLKKNFVADNGREGLIGEELGGEEKLSKRDYLTFLLPKIFNRQQTLLFKLRVVSSSELVTDSSSESNSEKLSELVLS